jgi:hypothetical protein
MNPSIDLSSLRRPGKFWETHGGELPIASYGAFRHYLWRRHANGLVASGAVVETRVGLLIHPKRFQSWVLTPRSGSADAP